MPVTIPATRKTPRRNVSHDEFIRDDTTLGLLAALPAQPGTTQMTAGNSTPLSDGAAALILASPARADDLGVIALARAVSSAVYGNDPLLMGIAPAWALPLALRRAGLSPGRSTYGRSTRPSARKRSVYYESCPTSSTDATFPTTNSPPTAVPWPSGIPSAPPHVTP